MNRKDLNSKKMIIGYHAQEHRGISFLAKPIQCLAKNAWLGVGYYFWVEELYARYWGEDFKKQTGFYDIYSGLIDDEKFINATFSEDGYYFFRAKIDVAITYLKDSGVDVTLAKVHRFLAEKIWPKLGITGIIYDDLPHNVCLLYTSPSPRDS